MIGLGWVTSMRGEISLAAIIGVAGAMMLTAFGCASVRDWRPALNSPPPVHHHVEHAAYQSRTWREHRRASIHMSEKKAGVPAIASAPDSAPASSGAGVSETSLTKPTITFADDGVTKDRAAATLAATNEKLARIDRAKLRGSDAITYEQANGFVIAARRAIQRQDYLAASGFARKASLLADKVAAAPHR
ncbi:MAG: hypothetical protein ACREP6_10000 [Candidatus Binataceae bacterium]